MIPLRSTIPARRFPWVTFWLSAANVAVFLFEIQLGPEALKRFFLIYGLVPVRYTHWKFSAHYFWPLSQFLPFLSSLFLHGGWLHIVSNLWYLWIFGSRVEDRMSRSGFLLFYLLCGIASGWVHWSMNPYSRVPAVGASGALSGVLGAYLALYPGSRLLILMPVFFYPLTFELPAIIYLGIWFYTQLYSGMLSLANPWVVEPIAFWAHVGGFIAGLILAIFFLKRRRI